MQEKNNLDAMAKKYKEEMMRIYNQNRVSMEDKPAAEAGADSPCVSEKPSAKTSESKSEAAPKADTDNKSEGNYISEADKSRLMNPPMPKIPNMTEKPRDWKTTDRSLSNPPMPTIPTQNGNAAESGESAQNDKTTEYSAKPRFLSAEELIRLDAEKSAPETAEQTRDARFESAPRDGHSQGNYDFSMLPDEEYKKEVEDFAGFDDDDLFFAAQGYLQVEVSAENGEPIDSAAIVVTERAGDMDTLVVTLVTGSDGKTEVIALPIPRNTERGGKMQGDYMITVYKEGYYTVYNLPVPIFDTIKSIQPVTVTAAEK